MSTSLAVDLESLYLNNCVSRASNCQSHGCLISYELLLVVIVTAVTYDYRMSRICFR